MLLNKRLEYSSGQRTTRISVTPTQLHFSKWRNVCNNPMTFFLFFQSLNKQFEFHFTGVVNENCTTPSYHPTKHCYGHLFYSSVSGHWHKFLTRNLKKLSGFKHQFSIVFSSSVQKFRHI